MTTAQDQQSRAVIAAWNAQADEHNQWETLGDDEKIDWAMKVARALPDSIEPELHMARKSIGEVDGFTVWEYEECCEDDDDAIAFFTAAKVQAMGRVPPEWQAVPVEPSSEMVQAGVEDLRLRGYKHALLVGAVEVWRAMLAAAPRPPAAQEGKPLTDEQMGKIIEVFSCGDGRGHDVHGIARAVEAAHGITHPTGD